MKFRIDFNKPYFTGNETNYIRQAVEADKISGNGTFTARCHQFFQQRYGFPEVFLTTSCTDALEMAAILLDIKPGDEVIVPSFTFVSTANAFVLRGATPVFIDSEASTPNLDSDQIEGLVTAKTRAIVAVHYAGIACNMDKIRDVAQKFQLSIVEDAAQAIDSYYNGSPLGTLGDLAAFSFHESKNIISGEGGMLVVNDRSLSPRAEIIWEKGTDRAAHFRGDVDKYTWRDIGSSFLPSDVIAAILLAQLEQLDEIQNKRKFIWNIYYNRLEPLQNKGFIQLPAIPNYATNNAHMFYVLCPNLGTRIKLANHLKEEYISALFHYVPLHKSPFFTKRYIGQELPNCERYSDTLLRLPMHYQLTEADVLSVVEAINRFFL